MTRFKVPSLSSHHRISQHIIHQPASTVMHQILSFQFCIFRHTKTFQHNSHHNSAYVELQGQSEDKTKIIIQNYHTSCITSSSISWEDKCAAHCSKRRECLDVYLSPFDRSSPCSELSTFSKTSTYWNRTFRFLSAMDSETSFVGLIL